MIDPCKLTIGSLLKHEGNYCRVIMLEEKDNEGKADVEITCRYLDLTQTVKGFIDFYIASNEKITTKAAGRKKR